MKRVLICVLFAVLCVFSKSVYADWFEDLTDGYIGIVEQEDRCMAKLNRGINNVVYGWAEPQEVRYQGQGPWYGGAANAAGTAGSGLVDISTFFAPPYGYTGLVDDEKNNIQNIKENDEQSDQEDIKENDKQIDKANEPETEDEDLQQDDDFLKSSPAFLSGDREQGFYRSNGIRR